MHPWNRGNHRREMLTHFVMPIILDHDALEHRGTLVFYEVVQPTTMCFPTYEGDILSDDLLRALLWLPL